ncbi:hypothetical protein NSK_004622 [Nannochloropsis salina CCMP1776]|uniref:Thioredoxin reductase n=1 Tax=Nannochloropsis salina CCMP1776 TaxID=1027361 RepID=A0A4D9D6E1_9STRA|nr:hypothetical protein NSK_004622 [Nannochloropsis salina CCMP1776]|eukprot:TFJ84149.1 hypothetical protein NSK_004622 [Nannochloropsis salina CCMP1776]
MSPTSTPSTPLSTYYLSPSPSSSKFCPSSCGIGLFHALRHLPQSTRISFPLWAAAAELAGDLTGDKAAENVVIVGSGPAGYTAAIYCARANLKPVIFEGASSTGGQLMATTDVENFPGFPDGILGPDLMMNMRKQAARWGAELESDDVVSVDLSSRPFSVTGANGRCVTAHSVIIATGAVAKRLRLPNEERYWSKGITACAICDGAAPMFSGEPLAVVGGGDSAAEEAVYLTKYSPEIHLLVRGGSMRASRALQDRVLANRKISVHYNTRVVDVSGDDPEVPFLKSPVTAVQVATTEGKTEVMKNLAVRGLFYAIGHDPNTALFAQFLDVDEKGYVRVAPGTPTTSLSGVFAAGDVQDPHWRQAVTAAGSGCMAALAAERYLSGEGLLREVHQPKDDVERKKGAGGRGGEKAVQEPREKQTEATAIPSDSNSGSGSGGGSGTGMRSLAAATEDDATDTYHKGEAALQSLLASSGKPILIMFMSKTCGPCRILKPILGRVLKEYEGRVHFVEIDIEEHPDLTLQSSVAGTPTVQLVNLKNRAEGEEVVTLRGVKKGSEYKAQIEEALGGHE